MSFETVEMISPAGNSAFVPADQVATYKGYGYKLKPEAPAAESEGSAKKKADSK